MYVPPGKIKVASNGRVESIDNSVARFSGLVPSYYVNDTLCICQSVIVCHLFSGRHKTMQYNVLLEISIELSARVIAADKSRYCRINLLSV